MPKVSDRIRVIAVFVIGVMVMVALIIACQSPLLFPPPLLLATPAAITPTATLPTIAASPPATSTPSPLLLIPTPTPTSRPTSTATPTRITAPTATSTLRPTSTPTEEVLRYRLTLTEKEVNELVQKGLAAQPSVPVSHVYVRLEPGQITASGRARLGFFTLDVKAVATVTVEDGKPVPQIVEIRAGGQPLTGFLRAQTENLLRPYLQQWLQAETNVYVEEVDIQEGQISITGRYK